MAKTKKKSLKVALITAILSIVACLGMFAGTTFAWFTDSVTSSNNIIKAGTLDVTMEYKNKLNDATEDWKDASKSAIFSHENWEPGYTEVKYIKVANAGSLAFKYDVKVYANLIPGENEVDLSEVIDVYFIDVEDSTAVTRADLVDANKKGTMDSVFNNSLFAGSLKQGESNVVAIVLRMQTTAGNEYMGLSAGDGFTVQLLATQLVSESDSFDNTYDENAPYDGLPMAKVQHMPEFVGEQANIQWESYSIMDKATPLETAYTFTALHTEAEAEQSKYANWHADFVIYADKYVRDGAILIGGNYGTWGWIGFQNVGFPVDANTEVRLLGSYGSGIYINYTEICKDVGEFTCGAGDYNDALAGTTITVELRLYETKDPADTVNNTTNEETGYYEIIGKYSYTFEKGEEVPLAVVNQFSDTKVDEVEQGVKASGQGYLILNVTGLPTIDPQNVDIKCLYSFSASDNATTVATSPYKDWIADFAVVFNKDVKEGAVGLIGEYADYGWIGFGVPDLTNDSVFAGVKANEAVLVLGTACEMFFNTPNSLTYEGVCTGVEEFNCGVFVNSAMASEIEAGTTVTVELRLYNPADPTDFIVAKTVTYPIN
ncbi:MAG: hypothetical protein E7353_09375 [Clostridiales bacterium]|nr:hypothetical protein [Clostridiales bacterium]